MCLFVCSRFCICGSLFTASFFSGGFVMRSFFCCGLVSCGFIGGGFLFFFQALFFSLRVFLFFFFIVLVTGFFYRRGFLALRFAMGSFFFFALLGGFLFLSRFLLWLFFFENLAFWALLPNQWLAAFIIRYNRLPSIDGRVFYGCCWNWSCRRSWSSCRWRGIFQLLKRAGIKLDGGHAGCICRLTICWGKA